MKKFEKIYIMTPPATITGGPEALFQLSDAINKQGGYGVTLFSSHHLDPIPLEYKKYETRYIGEQLENYEENLLIVPEIWTHLMEDKSIKTTKAIWWLSIDNGYGRESVNYSNEEILHFYQSQYAEEYLKSKGAKNILPLFDYLSDNYFEDYSPIEKRNLICYSSNHFYLNMNLLC